MASGSQNVTGWRVNSVWRNYPTASDEAALIVGSNNIDANILRVYSSDNPYGATSKYGFNLRYLGTGGGIDNQLAIFADNQAGTEVKALSINQAGQIGIKTAASSSYDLYVNGTSLYTGRLYGNTGNGLEVQSLNTGSWKEGIRVYNASNNYSVVCLCNSDLSDLLSLVHNGSAHKYYIDLKNSGTAYVLTFPQHTGTFALTDGHGASGTWEINITGEAVNAKNTQSGYGAKKITVGGNANTYYPVLFSNATSHFAWSLLNITRGYSEPAPDTWNTATHRGGLTLTILTNGDTAWGGNHDLGVAKLNCILDLSQDYCTMVGGIATSVNGLIVWLRGGGADYWITSNNGQSVSADVKLSTYTASNGATFAARTTPDTTEIDSYRWNNLWTVKNATNATNATKARYVEGDNDAANPGGALLRSGSGRGDASPAGDTWIFYDTLGGTSAPWGIRHDQAANTISFVGSGTQGAYITLNTGNSKFGTISCGAITSSSTISCTWIDCTRTSDHGIKVGTIRGRAYNNGTNQTSEYIHMYERVHIGSPSGWGSRNAPQYGLSTYGGCRLNTDTGDTTIGHTALDNTAFTTVLRLFHNESNESSDEAFTQANSSWGITFQRQWNSGTTCDAAGGIYAVGSVNWGTGFIFRTHTHNSSNGSHNVNALWISPIGRVGITDTSPDAALTISAAATDSVGAIHVRDTRTDGGWHYPFLGTCASLPVGANMYICIGLKAATGYAAGLRYNYAGASSNSNLMGFEFYGQGTKLWCYANGNGGVSGTWEATRFNGPLTGNVTGNCSGSSGSCTGNAASATKLQTSRSIWGQSFNGTGDISGSLTTNNSINLSTSTYGDARCQIKISSNRTFGMHLGSGGVNRGLYDWTNNHWFLYYDDNNTSMQAKGGWRVAIQTDGNLVVYNGTTAYWSAKHGKHRTDY